MNVTIREFVESICGETIISVYSSEDNEVIGTWWSDELPTILDEYSVESIDPPYVDKGGRIVLALNSDECSIENLAYEVDTYCIYDYEDEDGENDMSGMWKKHRTAIFGGDEE